MFRTSYTLLKHTLKSSSLTTTKTIISTSYYCTSAAVGGGGGGGGGGVGVGEKNDENSEISYAEVKRLMRLVNAQELKKKLGMDNREVIEYGELLEACKSMGLANTADEATAFSRILDQAGVVLLFRDKVYLHPHKVVDLVRKAVPVSLLAEEDPRQDEMNQLQKKMEEIDKQAHKQVRQILWAGLGLSMIQVGLFFRLTYWEFSWDVMEPIAFFSTATGLVVGYAYFMFTSRDPTYQDFMKRIFLSRQRKLIKKHNFDIKRFVELHKRCKTPPSSNFGVRKEMGIKEPEDLLQDH